MLIQMQRPQTDRTFFRVCQGYLDRVALHYTDEKPRHFAVKGPVAIDRAASRIQCPDRFLRSEAYVHDAGSAVSRRRWKIGRIANDVGGLDGRRRKVCMRDVILRKAHHPKVGK